MNNNNNEHGAWQGFLDSLATKGGNILLLVLGNVVLVSLVIWLHLAGFDKSSMTIAISQTLGNFSGALLMSLTGKERASNGAAISNDSKLSV